MQVRPKTLMVFFGVLVAAIGSGVYWYGYLGTPFIDEWHCTRGEAPYIENGSGGRGCLPDDSGDELMAGRSWDPLGNRPFICHDRRGWTEIHRDDEDDCLRDGRKLPLGWTLGPAEGQDR